MTAPQPAPGSDSVRAQIAEALREAMDERTYEQMTVCPNGCSCRKQTDDPDAHDCGCAGPCCMAVDWWDGRTDAEAYADVLVPLVDSLRAEAKAEALEEEADDVLPAPFGDDDAGRLHQGPLPRLPPSPCRRVPHQPEQGDVVTQPRYVRERRARIGWAFLLAAVDAALLAVWQGDQQWLATAGVLLVPAAAFGIGSWES